jgi:hypothetical protein
MESGRRTLAVARPRGKPAANRALAVLFVQKFLMGRKEGKPATISGELRLPRPGTDRVPLIFLLHCSGKCIMLCHRLEAGRREQPLPKICPILASPANWVSGC